MAGGLVVTLPDDVVGHAGDGAVDVSGGEATRVSLDYGGAGA